jgi:hypothetical protein
VSEDAGIEPQDYYDFVIAVSRSNHWARSPQIFTHILICSGVDPGCLSWIPDPDFYPGSRILIFIHPGSRIPNLGSLIPDPTTAKRRGKIFCCPIIFSIHKYHKIVNNFFFLAKKLRIIVLYTQNFVNKLSKIWVWDPGSGKNLFRIQGQKGTGSATQLIFTYLGCWALWDHEQYVNRFGSFAAGLSATHNRESPARTVPPAHRKEVTSSARVLSLVLWIRIRI